MRIVPIMAAFLAVGCADEVGQPGATTPLEMSAPEEPDAQLLGLSAQQDEGRRLFEMLCWTCHGEAGRGDGPIVQLGEVPSPPNFQLPEYATASPEELEALVMKEHDEGPSPGDHMSYVRAMVRADKFQAALSYIPVLVYPADIPGSALKGRGVYELRCQLCHGELGAGDGYLGRSLSPVKPVDFTQDTLIAKRDWPGLFDKVTMGGRGNHTAMPPFGSFFSEGEMWDLVAYIATLQPGVLQPATRPPGG